MISLRHRQSAGWRKQNKAVLVTSTFVLLALIFILLRTEIARGPLVFLAAKLNFARSGEAENNEMRLLSARLETLENENKTLKAALEEKTPGEIPAEIKLGGGYLFSDILLLNKGRGDGLDPGDIVLSPEKIFVGKIAETGDGWSSVHPVGRFGEKTTLRTGANKEITFEAEGTGRGELLAELPKDAVISVGDVVWLGEGQGYPVGLVAGIKRSEGRKMQDITIASSLPLGSLARVLAIKSK